MAAPEIWRTIRWERRWALCHNFEEVALGYTQGEVARAFAKIDTESLETEEIIKQGLKALARF